jgi:hypothetical protein
MVLRFVSVDRRQSMIRNYTSWKDESGIIKHTWNETCDPCGRQIKKFGEFESFEVPMFDGRNECNGCGNAKR